MSLPSPLQGLAEIKGALAVDPSGRTLSAEPAAAGQEQRSLALAAMTSGIGSAGAAARLGALTVFSVKGAASSSVAAVRPDAILQVAVDPATTTAQVERALKEWAAGGTARPAASQRSAPPSRIATPSPIPAAPARTAPVPAPKSPAPAPRAAPQPAAAPRGAPPKSAADPWAALRRSLGRGQLTEALALQSALPENADLERAGSEEVTAEECDRAMRVLLEGIGSVMAGDGVGGVRILEALASPSTGNLSFRWLALLWSARADLKSGAIPAARTHVQEALTTARQLDIEARALSQWIAAEVLAHDGDATRALAWLGEARSRFERSADPWGAGQTWLSEARVLTAAKREQEAAEAARQASVHLPDSEEPAVALARLAVIRDDLGAAEKQLRPLKTQAAERIRALAAAVRGGLVSRADASEFVREQEAPPSERALRSLERIANAAPRFAQAREALAWMLLRLGRYDDAAAIFRGLLGHPLSPADRASVMLGLGCIASAQGTGSPSATPLRAVVAGGARTEKGRGGDDLPALPPLSASALLARTQQGSGAGSVFSGQLSSFALPDLLEFLRSGRRTGLLVCSSASGLGALRFRDGWITSAASPSTPSVGEVLVRSRTLAPEVLQELIAALGADQPDSVVGERLVQDGLADSASVQKAFERQIDLAVRELMHWTDGEFTFNREVAPETPAFSVALDPQGLLLNAFKDADEASRDAASG